VKFNITGRIIVMTLNLTNLPDEVGRALYERAAAEQKPVEAVAIAAIAQSLGVMPKNSTTKRDLSFMTVGPPLEPEVLRALEEQRQIDPELWK